MNKEADCLSGSEEEFEGFLHEHPLNDSPGSKRSSANVLNVSQEGLKFSAKGSKSAETLKKLSIEQKAHFAFSD